MLPITSFPSYLDVSQGRLMDRAAFSKAFTQAGNVTPTCNVLGSLLLARAATTKASPPRPWPHGSTTRAVRASNCTPAHRHSIRGKPRPALFSSWRLSSTTANKNPNSTNADPDAAEALLRALPNSLEGIGEALTHEDLKPSAPWGLAAYRTAYGDDAAWRRMRKTLSSAAAEALKLYGCAESLLPRLSTAFIEDRATLEGAGVRDVRRRFVAWAAEELWRNWRDGEQPSIEEEARLAGVEGPGYFAGTRYNYCLLVDEVCLESLDRIASPVVKLLRKDFADDEEGGGDGESSGVPEHPDWEDGVTDCDEEDVGWMYLPVADYVDCCNQLYDPEFWHDGYYVRLPLTFLNRDLASAPGFWRRQGREN